MSHGAIGDPGSLAKLGAPSVSPCIISAPSFFLLKCVAKVPDECEWFRCVRYSMISFPGALPNDPVQQHGSYQDSEGTHQL